MLWGKPSPRRGKCWGNRDMSKWEMEDVAVKLCERLWSESTQRLPNEILKIDDGTAGIVVDIGGADYILTMQRVPKQRVRPAQH